MRKDKRARIERPPSWRPWTLPEPRPQPSKAGPSARIRSRVQAVQCTSPLALLAFAPASGHSSGASRSRPRMNAPVPPLSFSPLRPEAENAPASGIVEVANYGRLKPGMIPLWVGEGDLPTPAFICEAATRSLLEGETFYTWQRGIPDLREALARYHERLYRRPSNPDRFFVTIGGMHAAQIAF